MSIACDYYGSKRFILNSGSKNLPHSISLDIFENAVYYADTTKIAIMKFMRHTITTEVNVTYHFKLNANNLPRSIRIFHQSKQQLTDRSNPCRNHTCDHLCLLGPYTSNNAVNSYRCKCKLGYELKRDLKSCQRVLGYYSLLSTTNIFYELPSICQLHRQKKNR